MPDREQWIPNIEVGKEYDQQYAHAAIHYDSLTNFAGHFGRDMPVHRHANFWQLHFIDQGEIHFHIDDRHFHAHGPVCFVTPATVPHSFQLSEQCQGHVITLHQALVWQQIKQGVPSAYEASLRAGFGIFANQLGAHQDADWQLLVSTLANFASEWRRDQFGKAAVLDAFTRTILLCLLRLSPNGEAGRRLADTDFRVYRQFSELIEQLYAQQRPLVDYLEALCVSESRLNQICRRMGNRSPKRLINDRIIQEACRLLTHSNRSCNDIAFALGFRDPSYFSRIFKKHTGMTANSYRKSLGLAFDRG